MSNELIKDLISYDPEKLFLENIRRAEQRWIERKSYISQSNEEPVKTEHKPVILSLYGICYGITIFCFLSLRFNTKSYLEASHLWNLSAILYEDHILQPKILKKVKVKEKKKRKENKRKGRFIK